MNDAKGSVFISYKREVSWQFAQFLKAYLTNIGHDVFLDVSSLSSGLFEGTTLNEIASRNNFIVILEQGSLEGCIDETCWIAREVRHAIAFRRNVVPVTCRQFNIHKDINPDTHPASIVELRGYNALEFSSSDVDGKLQRLVCQFLSAHETSNREEGIIASYQDCVAWGWSDARIEREILELAFATMPGMHASAAIRRGELAALLAEHQDTWRVLTTKDHYLLGYWHFVPLFTKQFQDAWAGTLLEQDITAAKIPSIEVPGSYDVYVAGISIRQSHRSTSSLPTLLLSFTTVARSLAAQNIYIRKVCANAISPAGESLCRTLGLERIAMHSEHGSVYGALFGELVQASAFLRSQLLQPYSVRR